MAHTAQAAAAGTAFTNLKEKTSPETKRMAGVLLAALMLPSVGSAVDNQDEGLSNYLASAALTGAGTIGGGYLGYRQGHLPTDLAKEAYARDAIKDLKAKSQLIAAQEGPAAGVKYFAEAKQQMLQEIEGIDPKRANAFNNAARQIPEFGDIVADLDLLRKTPREVSGMTRGAALGALASALPAYLALRGGEIE